MRHGVVQKLLAPLASLGRMALTNYLLQTVIILTLSNLLDWPGTVHVSTQMIAAAAILLLQIISSTLIFKRFRMGPVEYLWRLGTYGKNVWLNSNKILSKGFWLIYEHFAIVELLISAARRLQIYVQG